jgi:hypothetical protein
MNGIKLILVLSNIPICASMVLALSKYKRLSVEWRIFSWFIIVSAVIQCISVGLWWFSINNLFLNHILVPAGSICIAAFYKRLLKGFINGKVILQVLGIFLVATMLNSIFVQPVTTFNSYALALQCILIVILSLATYILLMNHSDYLNSEIDSHSLNWINSGLFIYYASVLILFYAGDAMIKSLSIEVNRYAWLLH